MDGRRGFFVARMFQRDNGSLSLVVYSRGAQACCTRVNTRKSLSFESFRFSGFGFKYVVVDRDKNAPAEDEGNYRQRSFHSCGIVNSYLFSSKITAKCVMNGLNETACYRLETVSQSVERRLPRGSLPLKRDVSRTKGVKLNEFQFMQNCSKEKDSRKRLAADPWTNFLPRRRKIPYKFQRTVSRMIYFTETR